MESKQNNYTADRKHLKLGSNFDTRLAMIYLVERNQSTLGNTLQLQYFSCEEFREKPINDKIKRLQIWLG